MERLLAHTLITQYICKGIAVDMFLVHVSCNVSASNLETNKQTKNLGSKLDFRKDKCTVCSNVYSTIYICIVYF